jgi:hypothetical protein
VSILQEFCEELLPAADVPHLRMPSLSLMQPQALHVPLSDIGLPQ